MNNDKYEQSTNIFLAAFDFAYKIVEKDKKKVEEEFKQLQDEVDKTASAFNPNYNSLSSVEKESIRRNAFPKSFNEKYEEKKKQLEKLTEELDELDSDYKFRIDLIKAKNNPDKEVENYEIGRVLSQFFSENRRPVSGMNLNIENGNSAFQRIVSSTVTYNKISDKINKLNEKLSKLPEEYYNPNTHPIILPKSERIKWDIETLQRKKEKEDNKRNLIMLKREDEILKRSEKISKLEAKRDLKKAKIQGAVSDKNGLFSRIKNKISSTKGMASFKNNLDNVLVENLDRKIEKLKTKDIKMKGSGRILFEQAVISIFKNKAYDSKGMPDTRTWVEKRVEAISQKSGRSL